MFDDIFDEMERMRSEMEKTFSNIRKQSNIQTDFARPAMDIIDKPDRITVLVDLPGMKKEDINIECTDNYLQITAKSSEKKEEKKEGMYLAERSASSFKRGTSLPAEVNSEKATSSFNNGVLEINLPKKQPEKPKKKRHKIKVE